MQKKLLFTFGLTLLSLAIFAQISVKGVVTDSDGSQIPGVTVMEKGTTSGTLTDENGQYEIQVASDAILIFSYIGYSVKEVPVNEQTLINVVLETETGLEEVVIVGYGFKKKSLITGAISSLDADEFTSSVTRAEQVLQGKTAGVNIIPSSGSPGGGIKVRIRGAGSNKDSEPLYIVDGMKTGDINYLDPSDIESIEVLKDAASSAIYGTEGANGVIIIKTKNGDFNGKSSINYSFQYGIQSAPNLPDLMNATEYATYMREIYDPATFTNVPDPNNLSDPTGTNWYDAVFKNAPMMKHHVSFSGGNTISKYLVSGGYLSQDGIVGGDKASFERINARFNSEHKVKKWLELGNNLSFSNFKRNAVQEDDGFNGVLNSMIMMDPTTPAIYAPNALPQFMVDLLDADRVLMTDADGNYYGISNWITDGEIYNPLIRIARSRDRYTDNKFMGNVYGTLKPFKGFDITSRIGIDMAFQNFNTWTPSFYGNTTTMSTAPVVSVDEKRWSTWLWENFASYHREFENHSLTLMAGVASQKYTYSNLETEAGNMLQENENYRYPDYIDDHSNDVIAGGFEIQTQLSVFSRLSYGFANKYLFEATFRRDGSSLFGSNNKYANFPSVSAGWVISEESFWTLDKINYIKLRASWGQNGSLSNLGVNQYRSLITTQNIVYPDGNGNLIPGAEPDLLANPDLRWETSEQIDIGLDLSMFQNNLYANIDYFNKITRDLLTDAQPALSTGNDAPLANAGDVVNKGIEINLGIREMKKDFQYDFSINVTKISNEVTFLNEQVTRIGGADLPTLGTLTFFEVGQPVWYFRGYETDGIFQDQAEIDQWLIDNNITDAGYLPQPGDPIIVNNKDDGQINDEDMDFIGSPHPDWIFAANLTLKYKGFDFNVFAQGTQGNENFIGFIRADRTNGNRLAYFYDERWTPENTDSELPRADYNEVYLMKSDLMVDNGSYLKIRQIQLGYTIPTSITKKALINNARLYVSLNDYFTFTKYKGMDPEVGSGSDNRQGLDFGFYPVSKKFLFGLSLTF